MRSKPIARDDAAAVDTDGSAFAIPTTVAARLVKIYVSARAFIGLGGDDSPPAATEDNTTHQEAATEVVYTLDGHTTLDGSHVYVYAVTGTLTARVSFYG